MHVNLVFADLGDFVRNFKGRVSLEGMTLLSDDFHKEGTVLELTISLSDDLVLIKGTAGVLRSREVATPAGPACAMILRFIELDEDGKSLIQRMEDRHAEEGVRPYQLDGELAAWRESPPTVVPQTVVGGAPEEPPPDVKPADEPHAEAPQADAAVTAAPETVHEAVSTTLEPTDAEHSPDLGEQQTETAPPAPPKPKRSLLRPALVGLAVILAAVVVVAAVVNFFPGLFGVTSSEQVESPSAPVPTAVEEPQPIAVATEEPAAGAPPDDETTDSAAHHDDQTIASIDPTAVPTPSPAATIAPTPPEVEAREPVEMQVAARVQSLEWREDNGVTEVIITADGHFTDSQLRHFRLDNEPGPRLVLQIVGIDHSQLSYNNAVHGLEVTKIRAWHHSDKRPPELHVVCDLSSQAVILDSLKAHGNDIVIRFSSPRESLE